MGVPPSNPSALQVHTVMPRQGRVERILEEAVAAAAAEGEALGVSGKAWDQKGAAPVVVL